MVIFKTILAEIN